MSVRRTAVVLIVTLLAASVVVGGIDIRLWQLGQGMDSRSRPTPTQVSTGLSSTSSGAVHTLKVDLDAIGPAGPGRDLAIMNCDYCHSWTCLVVGQRTVNHWEAVLQSHRVMARGVLPDRDWTTLGAYLEENFSDRNPEPSLPSVYQGMECSYAEGGF